MVKTEDLLLWGAIGLGAYMILKGGLDIGSILGGIFGKPEITEATAQIDAVSLQIEGLTGELTGLAGEIDAVTQFIHEWSAEQTEVASEIMGTIDQLEAGIENLKADEQFAHDVYTAVVTRDMNEAISIATESPALANLYERDPAMLQWLIRNMPYAVGLQNV